MNPANDEHDGLEDAERHGEVVYRCLRCASIEAGELLTAECDPRWRPTRTIGERQRAIDVMRLVLARAQTRIARDAERPAAVRA
ncbi:MAG TPA: hypothetical protein VEB43_01845, partial [Anaeromyxobacter sp.]|nr:hypothetical protein [Anaeromyxobacter sp.]